MASGTWLKDSQVLEKFEKCFGQGANAKADDFAEASLALISVFDLITGMGVASSDMRGNANTIKGLATAGVSLADLVDAETGAGANLKAIASDGKKATCALLWLGRALNFIIKMLEELIEDKKAGGSKKMSECVLAGYEVSLKPHHGFMVKGTFSVAVKAAPSKEKFIDKLGNSADGVACLDAIDAKMEPLKGLVKAVQDYLQTKDAALFAP